MAQKQARKKQTRRSGGTGWLFFVATLLVVGGVGFAVWRGTGPLPDPEGCTATVAGLTVALAPDQAENASLIAAIGVRRGLPARAVSIALATAYQESKIRNLDHGDRDSVGIFQQRPSQGWGTSAQIRDAHYAINKFYEVLEHVDGYEQMRITEAAQRVQRSGFPEAYEDHAADARVLASALTGYSGGGRFSCVVRSSETGGTARAVTADLRAAFGALRTGRGTRQDVTVTVPASPAGRRLAWAVAQYAVAHADRLHVHEVSYADRTWRSGRESEDGWRRVEPTGGRVVRIALG